MIKISISKQIFNSISIVLKLIIQNIDDVLIMLGFTVLIVSLFLFVSVFAGLMGLSVLMIGLGLILGKIKTK